MYLYSALESRISLSGGGWSTTGASSVHVWKRSVTALVLVVQAADYTRWKSSSAMTKEEMDRQHQRGLFLCEDVTRSAEDMHFKTETSGGTSYATWAAGARGSTLVAHVRSSLVLDNPGKPRANFA